STFVIEAEEDFVAVRIRMKRMGRKNRPFYRVVAVDSRGARDGRVLEYLGHYDPMVSETDARALLHRERIDYWLSVGAQPSDKVGVLIKKYGTHGTHLSQQQAALERAKAPRRFTPAAPPVAKRPAKEKQAAPSAAQAENTSLETAGQES
ncbi:MAG: 30S ribosomal protein S16, partial [Pirellulaceae bacterium]